MSSVQECCYQHEGTLNKFLIDDKGMLFLLAWSLKVCLMVSNIQGGNFMKIYEA